MKRHHASEYVWAIVANLFFVWLAWQVPAWWPSLVLPSYYAALWVVTLAAGAQIAGNAMWLVNDEPWFKALVETFMHAASLASSATLYYIMPFNFGFFSAAHTIEMIVHWALLISIVVTAVMVVVRFLQFVSQVLSPRPVEL